MKLLQTQITPVIELTYVSPLLDVVYLNPVVAVTIDERGLNKYARDSVNEIDSATIEFGKGILDVANPIDDLAIGLSKLLADIGYTEDEISLSIGYIRAFAETVDPLDSVANTVGKALADSQSTSDAIGSFDIEKILSDTATLVDFASLSDGDGLEYILGKGITDATTDTTDSSTLSFDKALTEELAGTDAGALRMTDYADITYFAEDYVGSSRTF